MVLRVIVGVERREADGVVDRCVENEGREIDDADPPRLTLTGDRLLDSDRGASERELLGGLAAKELIPGDDERENDGVREDKIEGVREEETTGAREDEIERFREDETRADRDGDRLLMERDRDNVGVLRELNDREGLDRDTEV